MRINSNVGAMVAHTGLGRTQSSLSKSLERLSSGLRINRAGDDAGGLSISETLRAQVRGTRQALKNVQDGLGAMQTADGGAQEIGAALQRMRELAVQAANGTYTATDRQALQVEISEVIAEIDRLAQVTTFNGITLLTGGNFTVGDYATVQNTLQNSLLGDAWDLVNQVYGLTIEGPIRDLNVYFDEQAVGGTLAYVSATGGPFYPSLELHVDMYDFLPGGGLGTPPLYNDRILAHELTHAMQFDQTNYPALPTWFMEGSAEFVHGADERTRNTLASFGGDTPANRQAMLNLVNPAAWGGSSNEYSAAYVATRYLDSTIPGGIQAAYAFLENNPGATMDQVVALGGFANQAAFVTALQDGTALAWMNAAMTPANLSAGDPDTGSAAGFDYTGAVLDQATVVPNGTGLGIPWNVIYNPPTPTKFTLQVGPDETEVFVPTAINAQAGALGVDTIDVTTQVAAQAAITTVDAAIDTLSGLRATIGAESNRLEAMAAALAIDDEMETAAESRIRDADMASESLLHAKSQILANSGMSVLAAANQQPQRVATLLQSAAQPTTRAA